MVIPEDEGLKEKIEKVIADADTRGVTIEVVPSYGKGASKTEEKIIRDEKMRIIIETVISLVLMCTGYVGTCVYLKTALLKI